MRLTYALVVGGLVAAAPARAVYAPIPEPEQTKDLTVSVRGSFSYDSNIFGGAAGAISSNIWEISPRLSYNTSLTDQTFFSAIYGLTLDYFERRPGDKLLDSHDFTLRVAHAFSKDSTLDLNDVFMTARNPQSLLNGVPLNVDQSFNRNQLDAHYTAALTPKFGADFKVRSIYTKYRNAILGRSLDHIENLFGVAGDYAVLPELKAVGEVRHQDVYYRKQGELKNKHSNYAMTGVDYEVAKKLTLSSRVGAEWRHRASEPSVTAPYAEFTARYDYAEQSFITGGYAYTLDEPSDTARFTDEKVNRLFLNVQHALTALIVASVSADYEPGVLQGRRDTPVPGINVPNLNETATRWGGALTYLPTKNWLISATYDLDHTLSDDPSRTVVRHRVGVNATYTF